MEWLFSRFSPVLKWVSAGCNLRCGYCFYSGNQPEVKIVSNETLEQIVKNSLNVAPVVKFIAHGGEPLIAGIDKFNLLVDLARKYQAKNQKVSFSVQTNATLIDNSWIKFFKENRISVGVSLDGPDYVHDLVRVDASGKGTHSRVMKGIDLLRGNGIKCGIVAVVNSRSLKYTEDLFNFMHTQRLQFAVNPCTANPNDPTEVKSLSISPMQYAEYLLELLDLWLELNDPSFIIRPLDDLVKAVLNRQPSLCRFAGQCHQYVTIDSNGDVYPCDTFLDTNHRLGNAADQAFPEIFSGTTALNYYSGRKQLVLTCNVNGIMCAVEVVCVPGMGSSSSTIRIVWSFAKLECICLSKLKLAS